METDNRQKTIEYNLHVGVGEKKNTKYIILSKHQSISPCAFVIVGNRIHFFWYLLTDLLSGTSRQE